MKHIKRIDELNINRMLTKGKEILNYSKVKENNKIGKKYIDMIYDDYRKKNDLLKVFLNTDSMFLKYKISDNYKNFAGIGNMDKGDIEIKLNLADYDYDNDISGARIEASVFIPYKGNLPLFGRDMKTNDLIIDDNGIEDNVYDYINISQSDAINLMEFFKKEYINKYPEMKNEKVFNYMTIFKYDKELYKKIQQKDKDEREIYEKNRKERETIADSIIDKSSISTEDIEDLILELDDEMDFNVSISPAAYVDGRLYMKRKMGRAQIYFTYKCDGLNSDSTYWVLYFNEHEDEKFDISKVQDFFSKSTRINKMFNIIGIKSRDKSISASDLPNTLRIMEESSNIMDKLDADVIIILEEK